MRFLNIWHEEELRILMPRLFHSAITGGKKGFFKKLVFTLKKGIWLLRALCEAYGLLFSGIKLKS